MSLSIVIDCALLVFFSRLPQIYEEFYHTINNADHEKDLKWWSNNHGVNMAMNWPQFEVSSLTLVAKKKEREALLSHVKALLVVEDLVVRQQLAVAWTEYYYSL